MGGNLNIDSDPYPVPYSHDGMTSHPSMDPNPPASALKLLIVDDLPLNLKMLRTALEAEGHEVVEATNGVKALEALRREPFDAIVSDILMPEMDGFRLCMEVRDDERLRALPLVLYTSTYNKPSDRELGESCGADAYIRKPAPVASILDAIRQAQRSPRASTSADPSRIVRLYSKALTRKLDEKRELVQRETMQHAITRMLGEGRTTGDVMPGVIRTLCEGMGWIHGAWWSWDAQKQTLRCSDRWGDDSPAAIAYAGASPKRIVSPKAMGFAGDDWWAQPPAWIRATPDGADAVVSETGSSFATLLLPIRCDEKPAGVLQFVAAGSLEPDDIVLQTADAIASQLGQFIARVTAEEEIRRLAHYDFLTGLPNRYLFEELASRAIVKAHRDRTQLALLFIDLDGFKQVNDLYGHDAGDHVLATFALRLRDCLRQSDAIGRHVESSAAARLGGDEFVALIEGLEDRPAIEAVAQRILNAARKPFDLAGPTGHIGASIGIALYPDDGPDLDHLRQAADSAMYDAKEAGRNAYRFRGPIAAAAVAHEAMGASDPLEAAA